MFKDKIKELGKHEENNKKKIENIVFLIIILIITIIIINVILNDDEAEDQENETSTSKTLATTEDDSDVDIASSDLERDLEDILSTIKGVGDVNVFVNYSESSKIVAMYDEKTTTSSTEETDSSGGVRNTVSTETEKNVIYSEEDGDQTPVTEKIIMPTIEGAIVTAEGASSASVKADIVSAIQAATGLSADKIQVFEMEK